jgi:micrococcal nuclease
LGNNSNFDLSGIYTIIYIYRTKRAVYRAKYIDNYIFYPSHKASADKGINMENIGQLLKLERRKTGMSQKAVSDKMGISQSAISQIESGEINFTVDTLQRYVDALGFKLNLISKDSELYHYTARVQSVYDGDTCRVDIDLGLGTWILNEKLRLVRINAPEVTGKEKAAGLASRDYLRDLIDGKQIIIETVKDKRGKYGRYLAEVWIERNGGWANVNDLLVNSGHAVYQDY